MAHLAISDELLKQFCRKQQIRRLSLFGSTLSGTARPDSDVDLLVEFEPGCEPGLLGLATMEAELAVDAGREEGGPTDTPGPEPVFSGSGS
jgi:predicted nucleotidyltransferase